MEQRGFARKPLGEVQVDLCFACNAMWFDSFESAQLTPGAVLELFRLIHEHEGSGARPRPARMPCPRCEATLKRTQDMQRTQRIAYDRCPEGHGRFITFFQFLREKEFVRELTRGEIEQLRATVAQVRCSSCGGPVDLGRDAHCRYCQAPISILDPQAVGRTLEALAAQERQRSRYDAKAATDALFSGRRAISRQHVGIDQPGAGAELVDLVSDAIDFLCDVT
jgi:Zn-finger nucleic acid-binding protein